MTARRWVRELQRVAVVLVSGAAVGGIGYGIGHGTAPVAEPVPPVELAETAPTALRKAVESGVPVAFAAPADAHTTWSCDAWVALPNGTVWRVPAGAAVEGTPLRQDTSTARGKYVLFQRCDGGSNEKLPPQGKDAER